MKKKILQLMILGAFWLPLTAGDSHAAEKCQDKLAECRRPEEPNRAPYCAIYANSEDAIKACEKSYKATHSTETACTTGCRAFHEEDHCNGWCVLGNGAKTKKSQK